MNEYVVLFNYRSRTGQVNLSTFIVEAYDEDLALEAAKERVAEWPGASKDILGLARATLDPQWFEGVEPVPQPNVAFTYTYLPAL